MPSVVSLFISVSMLCFIQCATSRYIEEHLSKRDIDSYPSINDINKEKIVSSDTKKITSDRHIYKPSNQDDDDEQTEDDLEITSRNSNKESLVKSEDVPRTHDRKFGKKNLQDRRFRSEKSIPLGVGKTKKGKKSDGQGGKPLAVGVGKKGKKSNGQDILSLPVGVGNKGKKLDGQDTKSLALGVGKKSEYQGSVPLAVPVGVENRTGNKSEDQGSVPLVVGNKGKKSEGKDGQGSVPLAEGVGSKSKGQGSVPLGVGNKGNKLKGQDSVYLVVGAGNKSEGQSVQGSVPLGVGNRGKKSEDQGSMPLAVGVKVENKTSNSTPVSLLTEEKPSDQDNVSPPEGKKQRPSVDILPDSGTNPGEFVGSVDVVSQKTGSLSSSSNSSRMASSTRDTKFMGQSLAEISASVHVPYVSTNQVNFTHPDHLPPPGIVFGTGNIPGTVGTSSVVPETGDYLPLTPDVSEPEVAPPTSFQQEGAMTSSTTSTTDQAPQWFWPEGHNIGQIQGS